MPRSLLRVRVRAGVRVRARAATLASIMLCAVCAGCPSPRAGRRPPTASAPPPLAAPSASSAPVAASTAHPCTPPAASAHDRALDALLAGRADEARAMLAATVRADPRDHAAEVLRGASVEAASTAREGAGHALASASVVTLAPLPFGRAPAAAAGAPVYLKKVSEKKNLITDFADWETRNGLTRVAHPAFVPSHVAAQLGGQRRRAVFVHPDHAAAVYGTTIVISAEGRAPRVFDASRAIAGGPKILDVGFVQLAGDTLLVSLAYNGYAKESGGHNGYFAAFDAASGRLDWSAGPLVSNVSEAVVTAGSVVTGYGFTKEPDSLTVLDVHTGAVRQKIPLKSAPRAIRRKGDDLYVRAYDVDYVFRSATPLGSATAASMPSGPAPSPTVDATARCWAQRAVRAVALGDRDALAGAVDELARAVADGPLLAALRRELAGSALLPLWRAPLVRVGAPPWSARTTPGAPVSPGPAPRLVRVRGGAADPIRNMNPTYSPDRPFGIAPVKHGALPPGARRDIPSSYGMEDLSAILPSGERTLLAYGGRYLAVVRGSSVERVFDLDALRHPPKANPQWKEFAVEDVTDARVLDGVLYVCNGGGSYAKEVYGKKGFVTALDATTGALLWRSPPLVCGATFGVYGGYLVTGYGFTAEPDHVFLLRRSDGRVMQKVSVDSAPSSVEVEGARVHVEAYAHTYDFDLRPR